MKCKFAVAAMSVACSLALGAAVRVVPDGGIASATVKNNSPEAIQEAFKRGYDEVAVTVEWDGTAFKAARTQAALKDFFAVIPKEGESKLDVVVRSKTKDYYDPFVKALQEAGVAPARVILFVTSPWEVIESWKAKREIPLGISGHCGMFGDATAIEGYCAKVKSMKMKAIIVNPGQVKNNNLTAENLAKYKAAGAELRFMSPAIKDEAKTKELLALGFDAVCTSSPGSFKTKYLSK